MEKEKKEEKEMKKKKKKKRKKKRKRIKIATLCLETRARSEGYMAKAFKAGVLNLHWLGVTDFVFATWVDRWSLASCRCLILEVIRSPG